MVCYPCSRFSTGAYTICVTKVGISCALCREDCLVWGLMLLFSGVQLFQRECYTADLWMAVHMYVLVGATMGLQVHQDLAGGRSLMNWALWTSLSFLSFCNRSLPLSLPKPPPRSCQGPRLAVATPCCCSFLGRFILSLTGWSCLEASEQFVVWFQGKTAAERSSVLWCVSCPGNSCVSRGVATLHCSKVASFPHLVLA